MPTAPPAEPLPAHGHVPLLQPVVLDAPSTAGGAPWRLPIGAAPNGLAADAARLGDLEVRAASVVGAGHRCEEPASPRQDAYALARSVDGAHLVIAVADGVSQSPRSDLGARVAVAAAVRLAAEEVDRLGSPDGIDAVQLFRSVSGEMAGTGRSRGLPDEDICSILIVAIVPTAPEDGGARRVWTAQVGDVSLWRQRGGELKQLTGPTKEGMDRNTVASVLPFHWSATQQVDVDARAGDQILVMTDGLSETLTDIVGAAEWFSEQWSGTPPHIAAFVHSLCYDAPGQLDDRTAVVVWCGAQVPVYEPIVAAP